MIESSENIKAEVVSDGSDILITIEGIINEDSKFLPLENANGKQLIFDLAKISMINSCGLRNWVHWMTELPKDVQVVYKKCPKQLVDQINILEGFMPKGALMESFYVPYYCENCGHEEDLLANRGEHYKEATSEGAQEINIPLTKPCPECDSTLEADVIPEKYFRFLEYHS